MSYNRLVFFSDRSLIGEAHVVHEILLKNNLIIKNSQQFKGCSQMTLTMFVGVVALRYQHHTALRC